MSKYRVVLAGAIISCSMYAMNTQKPLSAIESTMVEKALSKISFIGDKKVLHIGGTGQDLLKEKAPKVQQFNVDLDTLNKIEDPAIMYDKIISFTFWNIFKKSPCLLEQSKRLLKSGGQMCIILPHHTSDYLKAYNEVIATEKWEKRCHLEKIEGYSCRKIKELYTQAGMNSYFARELVKPSFIFKNNKRFIEWIVASMIPLENVFWWYYKELAQDVACNYIARYPIKSNKSIEFNFPYIIVSACKA
ncbi:MAG TPA: hypothetical protein VKU36_03915 [Candidatus Babeliales bacterium]|nr:hypothetical protein [Candidatus Babeliales bacterium]